MRPLCMALVALLGLSSLCAGDSECQFDASDQACKSPNHHSTDEGVEQNVWLLQTGFETARNLEAVHSNARQGDVYDYIQEMIDERAANEALQLVEQGGRRGAGYQDGEFNDYSELDLENWDPRHSAANLTGIEKNGEGDLKVLFSNMWFNGVIAAVCLFFFGILRSITPMVYSFRDTEGKSDGFLGWIRASYRLRIDDIQEAAGLDHAMMIEFTYMSMKILLWIGIPFLMILSPLDWLCGGNAAGKDHLSWMGLANVKESSWVCWFHAPAVWWAVLVTYFFMFRTMNRVLIPRRIGWLMHMSRLSATTVLVERIPPERATKAGLKSYFDEFVFGKSVVRDVVMVKDVSTIEPLVREREQLSATLQQTRSTRNEVGTVRRLQEVEDQLANLTAQADGDDSLNLTWAFLTFKHRREATVAIKMLSPDDEEEMEVRPAPEVIDVVWADLLKDPDAATLREALGFALIVGMYFVFLPTVVAISVLTDLNKLQEWFPVLEKIHDDSAIAKFWKGYVTPLALTIVMSFVPFLLYLISTYCFTLRAQSMVQTYLQSYSFYFQVVFVLLVTAVGNSFMQTSKDLLNSPMSVFSLLADSMPVATHFYMNYFVLQWSTHFLALLRLVPLLKFFWYQRNYDYLEAKEYAEPEDQADYGLGTRAGRWALLVVTALVFCDLAPLMTMFGFVNLVFTRLAFGYLFVFAETRKPDNGGKSLVTAMKQVQQGLAIFIALMTGVLLQRAATPFPGIIAAVAFLPLVYFYNRFRKLRWEHLEFSEVKEYDARIDRGEIPEVSNEGGVDEAPRSYKQPELLVVAPKDTGFFSRFRSKR